MFYTIDYSRKTKKYYLYQWRWSFVTGDPEWSGQFDSRAEALAFAKKIDLTPIKK